MKKKIIIVIILISVLLIVGLMFFKQEFNLLGDCDNQNIGNIISGEREIEISIVDCGATTDYSTHITFNDSKKETSEKVVVLKGNHNTDLKVEWLTIDKVSISYKGTAQDAFNFRKEINDVNFELNPF